MSELQAVFNARKNRASSDAGADDNNSENAIVPEVQSNAPSQTVTSNYTTNRSTSPIHTSNINTNQDGNSVEVSPSAIGRQSLQLNNSTSLFPSKDGPPATPPSMPSSTPSSTNPPIGRVNPGIKRITPRGGSGRQLPSPTGGSHGRSDVSQDLYVNNQGTQKPPQSNTSSNNTIVGRGSVRGNNRFGIRNSNPPTGLSPYEPSDEEPEPSSVEQTVEQATNNIYSSVKGAISYKKKVELKDGENELQKMLNARRVKAAVATTETNNNTRSQEEESIQISSGAT